MVRPYRFTGCGETWEPPVSPQPLHNMDQQGKTRLIVNISSEDGFVPKYPISYGLSSFPGQYPTLMVEEFFDLIDGLERSGFFVALEWISSYLQPFQHVIQSK